MAACFPFLLVIVVLRRFVILAKAGKMAFYVGEMKLALLSEPFAF